MSEYIQFPRYSIFLIPDKEFFCNLDIFYKDNNLVFDELPQSTYGIHFTVKAPFYLSHLYSESDLISHFNSLNKEKIRNILKRSFNIKGFGQFNQNLILEIESDQEFNFFIHDLMRSFDIYRKTLDYDEMKKDSSRYNNLSNKEFMYYQIWGYPYYFECSKHHISISSYKSKFKDSNFEILSYESVKLLKQDKPNERFVDLSVLT